MTTISQKRREMHRLVMRRLQLAGWQTSIRPAVEAVKHAWLQQLFGVESSKQLDETQLDIALREVETLTVRKPESDIAQMSMAQRSRIIRLGKYVLGKHYGIDWFWPKLRLWTEDYNNGRKVYGVDITGRAVSRLNDLSRSEAVHVIRVMEAIEFRLVRKGAIST